MDGIQTELKGNSDAYFIEGSDFSQFDAEAQSWNIIGEVVDANGGTPNCRWEKANGGTRKAALENLWKPSFPKVVKEGPPEKISAGLRPFEPK